MAGVLEYLTYELLELASNKAGEDKSRGSGAKSILPRHIMMAVRSDEEFNRFLKGAEFAMTGRMPTYLADLNTNKKKKVQQESESDEDMIVENLAEDSD